MKRKILAMILALTMAGTLLAGCQSSSGGTQNEAETPEEPYLRKRNRKNG